MAVFDLLGHKWLARVVWELRETPMTFRELQGRCDNMSPTVLNQRLSELREVKVVEISPEGGYTLSPSGLALLKSLKPLLAWSENWAEELAGN